MTHPTLRLLGTVSLRWALVPILILVTLGLLDSFIVADAREHGNAMGFGLVIWPFIPSAVHFGRFRAWPVLPVSRSDRRRAVWWVGVGLPLTWVILAMAGALVVVGLTAGVHAGSLRIAAALGAQVLAVTAAAAVFLLSTVLSSMARRRESLRPLAPWIAGGLACAVLGATFLPSPGPLIQLAAGAAALAASLMAYAFADKIGEAVERFRRGLPSSAPERPDVRMGHARGWAAMAPMALAALALVGGAALAATFFSPVMLSPEARASGAGAGQSPLAIVLVAWAVGGGVAIRTIRPLRILPMGAVALTLVLQGFTLAVAAAAFAAVGAAQALAGFADPRLYIFAFTSIPVLALNLPLNFRFGGRRAVYLVAVPIVLVTLVHLIPTSAGPVVAAASVVFTAAFWVWTWWELARGRDAYQPRLPIVRWRGAPG